jgi:hypothetical protein
VSTAVTAAWCGVAFQRKRASVLRRVQLAEIPRLHQHRPLPRLRAGEDHLHLPHVQLAKQLEQIPHLKEDLEERDLEQANPKWAPRS